nr:MAG TPA: hypothetical protein [Caudoviricetes sp.]
MVFWRKFIACHACRLMNWLKTNWSLMSCVQ